MNFKKIRDKYEPTEHENHSGEWYETYTVNQIQKETALAVIEEIEKLIPTKNLYSKGKDISVERIIELREQILMAELAELKKELQ